MKRLALSLLLILAMATVARAHFLFVVPEPGGREAYVFLSEDLDPDEDVSPEMVAGAKLYLRSLDGQVQPLVLKAAEQGYLVALPESGGQLVFGTLEMGVHQVGDKPGNLVSYFPKTILGDPFESGTRLSAESPVELVPMGQPGDVSFLFLLQGVPQAGVNVTVFLPDGGRKRVLTDEQGMTAAFQQSGRYGAWARAKMGGAGEYKGQTYAESRGYATLVAQIGQESAPETSDSYAPLPEAVSSFGAVESEGWLYIYGGHTATTHNYDTEAVSGRFNRMNLAQGSNWQSLPGGPALQGMNLAAHQGKIYRVGGMQPRNARGMKSDVYSVADCTRFNPESMQWEWIAPMPQGRSSHDLAVIDDTLYVVGGWEMLGREFGNEFFDNMLSLDLKDPRAAWKSIPQPFSRRALIVSVLDGRIYVMGGIDDEDMISRRVDIFDPKTMQWSTGPDLIGEGQYVGFASAACTLDGKLYASVAGGDLLRLVDDGSAWEFVGKHEQRIVHRLIPWKSQVLAAGGAHAGINLDQIEVIIPQAKGVRGSAPDPGNRTPIHGTASAKKANPKVSTLQAGSKLGGVAAQVFCPVMTKVEVMGDEDAVAVSYQGEQVLLCCSKCVKKWKKDPEAYLQSQVLPQLAGLELPERSIQQVYCPVYPSRVVSEKDPFVTYKGKKIYLFNRTAVRRWNANPEKYLNAKLLPQLAE